MNGRASACQVYPERFCADICLGLKEELANTEKDDSSTVSTVMAVAMAGRAIKPSLDVLQQLVKSQRENVAEVIEQEQRQIDKLKQDLDEIVAEPLRPVVH